MIINRIFGESRRELSESFWFTEINNIIRIYIQTIFKYYFPLFKIFYQINYFTRNILNNRLSGVCGFKIFMD